MVPFTSNTSFRPSPSKSKIAAPPPVVSNRYYAEVPNQARVAADLKQLGNPPALPYPGRYLGSPRRDYFKLGASLLWCGYPEQALPYLEAVIAQQPDNVRAIVLTAQIHREANRLDQAASFLDQALSLDPRSAEAWNEQGGIALARREYAQALEHIVSVARVADGDGEFWSQPERGARISVSLPAAPTSDIRVHDQFTNPRPDGFIGSLPDRKSVV